MLKIKGGQINSKSRTNLVFCGLVAIVVLSSVSLTPLIHGQSTNMENKLNVNYTKKGNPGNNQLAGMSLESLGKMYKEFLTSLIGYLQEKNKLNELKVEMSLSNISQPEEKLLAQKIWSMVKNNEKYSDDPEDMEQKLYFYMFLLAHTFWRLSILRDASKYEIFSRILLGVASFFAVVTWRFAFNKEWELDARTLYFITALLVLFPLLLLWTENQLAFIVAQRAVDMSFYVIDERTKEPIENVKIKVTGKDIIEIDNETVFYATPAGNSTPGWYHIPATHIPTMHDVPPGVYTIDATVECGGYEPFTQEALVALEPEYESDIKTWIEGRGGRASFAIQLKSTKSTIGDYVWIDKNRNGLQDENLDMGIEGIKVILTNYSSNENYTVWTDEKGHYEFKNINLGQYYLTFLLPPLYDKYDFTLRDQGENDYIDSDVCPATGKTETFQVTGGDFDITWDAGIYEVS